MKNLMWRLAASAALLLGLLSTVGNQPALAARAGAGVNGWNMVGAPNGSNFQAAEAMVRWDRAGQRYVDVAATKTNIGSDTPECTGYWAYFPAAVAVTLPSPTRGGETRNCGLSAGWNLVGNPYSHIALLPTGVTAYHWNTTAQAYEILDRIPVGASVWIYETASAVVTLTAS
jgi:hypothetical protein